MLLTFSFNNYRGVRETNTLDMIATREQNLSEHLTVVPRFVPKGLPVTIICGKNGSGKTTVLNAFSCFKDLVLLPPNIHREQPQSFNKSLNNTVTFEVTFSLRNGESYKVYDYGISIMNEAVVEEWLNVRGGTKNEYRMVFRKDNNNVSLANETLRSKIKSVGDESVPLLTKCAAVGAKRILPVFDWFRMSEILYSKPQSCDLGGCDKKELVSYLRLCDSDITDVQIDSNKIVRCFDNAECRTVRLSDEANSIREMVSFFLYIKDALVNGKLLMIDDFGNNLSTDTLAGIVAMFTNREINNNNAQLIFTTNNINILDSPHIRKDEVYFMDRNKDGSPILYSESIFGRTFGIPSQNYLKGKFNIPQIKGKVSEAIM